MRYIKKGQEPQSFTDWKSQENDDWQPTYKTLRGQIKAEVHDALLEEQGYICCYCGMSITRNISHIEHLQPQNDRDTNLPKDLALAIDFTNLLASCGIPEKSNQEYEKILHCVYHCGIKKGNNLLPVNPLQPDCEVFFRYLPILQGEEYDVEILPTEEPDKQQLAADTIKTLNLNYSKLTAMRGSAIKGALEAIEGLTQEEIERFIKSYEQPNKQAFSFAITYILKQFLDPKSI